MRCGLGQPFICALIVVMASGCGQPQVRRRPPVPRVVTPAPKKVKVSKRPVEQFLADIKDGKLDMSPEKAALIASGVDDKKELGQLLERYARLKQEALDESRNYLKYIKVPLAKLRDKYKSDPESEAKFDISALAGVPFKKLNNLVKAIYLTSFLRGKMEEGYQGEAYSFKKALNAFSTGSGAYNCLSVTLLWKLLANAVGVEAKVLVGDQFASPLDGSSQLRSPAQHVFLELDARYYVDMTGNFRRRTHRVRWERSGKKLYPIHMTVLVWDEVAAGLVEKPQFSEKFSTIRQVRTVSLIAYIAVAAISNCSILVQLLEFERDEWLMHKNLAHCFHHVGDARAQKYHASALKLSANPFTLMDMALLHYRQAREQVKQADSLLEEVIKKFPLWKGVVDATRKKNHPALAPKQDGSGSAPSKPSR